MDIREYASNELQIDREFLLNAIFNLQLSQKPKEGKKAIIDKKLTEIRESENIEHLAHHFLDSIHYSSYLLSDQQLDDLSYLFKVKNISDLEIFMKN